MPRVGSRRRTAASSDTRKRLLAAATDVLATEGFSAATARAIGERADCNPALVFYHFGTLNELLLAVMDASSERRLERYREAVSQAGSVRQLRATLHRLYREDGATGHRTILAELVAGGLMDRELGQAMTARVQPWLDLAEDAIRQALPTAALRRRVPVQHLAYAVVALFVGLETLGRLAGDTSQGDAVVERLTRSAP